MAIRREKALDLLSSLRLNRHSVDETTVMKMKKEIGELKLKTARERLTVKRIKLWGLFEFLLQLAMVFSICALFLILTFSGS